MKSAVSNVRSSLDEKAEVVARVPSYVALRDSRAPASASTSSRSLVSARASRSFRSLGRALASTSRSLACGALRVGLLAGVLAAAAPALAGPSCPEGMWGSHGSCCDLGDEYVPSKNQCLPVRPERRCVEGHLDDCVLAGRQLEQRGAIGAGYAAELYRYACDEGHAPACRGLGGLHERGLGLDRDEARARALYEQACDGGDAPACTLLAERLIADENIETHGSSREQKTAREPKSEGRASAHEPEEAHGSVQHGAEAHAPREQNKAGRALELFAQACHRGDAQACGELGEQLSRRPDQTKQSAGYFELACSGGVGSSCRRLLQREREVHEVAPARARELLDRGCRAADGESCVQLGDGLRNGSLAPQSSAQAALRYRNACEAGHLVGCVRLAELTAVGEGVARDLRRASELYARACGAGVKLACERASALAGK